ncbi:MAG: hypothetical protein IJ433_03565 [Ruminococcus sp.]|nr:hypothetical protein [Ruminococcus sp.]
MKKIISHLLILTMLLCFIPATSTQAIESTQTELSSATPDTAVLGSNSGEIPLNFNITNELELSLEYNDICAVDDYYSGYSIANIYNDTVTSYKVSGGKVTNTKDSSVLQSESDKSFYCSGVGSARVLLVKSSDLKTAQSVLNGTSTATVNSTVLNITVSPAPLTIVYISGQSNGEGSVAANLGYHPEDSVVCQRGEVFSTFAPSNDSRAKKISGISNYTVCTKEQAPDYVAGSLSLDNNLSVSGKNLVYKLNSLTLDGQGKTGPDSGFAYKYNQLTGDKIWVVNAAWGGTAVNKWVEGADAYERALAVYKQAEKTYNAEIASGHFTQSQKLCLWVQGEADKNNTVSAYREDFIEVTKNLTNELSLNRFGIILTRSSKDTQYKSYKDNALTAPRIVQPAVANDKSFDKVYLVSRAHELWVTDSGVEDYFKALYPQGILSYPLRKTATISAIPTTMYDVHNDVHFSQAGHNENGMDAAENMYHCVYGERQGVEVSWLKENGAFVYNNALDANLNIPFVLSQRIIPPQEGKHYSVVTDKNYLTYNSQSSTFTPIKKGSTTIKLVDENNNAVSTIKVTINTFSFDTPIITSFENLQNSVKINWDKVDGATYYRIYCHNGEKYVGLATTTSTTYTHTGVESGKTYTYTVRCVDAYNNAQSSYVKEGFKNTFLSAPVLTSVANSAGGVKVSWNKVNGAQCYGIYRKSSTETSYKRVGSTTSTSYVDTSAVSNTTYTYTVRCLSKDGTKTQSYYDTTGKTLKYIAAPLITSHKSSQSGITLYWDKVSGATTYRVFIKTADGWKGLGNTTTTNFTDYTATKKGVYTYTVRCIDTKTNTYISSFYSSGYTADTRLKTPVITSFENTRTGIKITWSKIDNAYRYTLFYHNGTQYKALTTTADTSYIHTGVVSGQEYTYTVRCVGADGTFESDYVQNGFKTVFLSPPVLKKPVCVTNGVRVSWLPLSGAQCYRVYRKGPSDTSWVKLADTATPFYVDSNVKNNTSYTYTVRCISKDKSKFDSSFDANGKSVLYKTTALKTPAEKESNKPPVLDSRVSAIKDALLKTVNAFIKATAKR